MKSWPKPVKILLLLPFALVGLLGGACSLVFTPMFFQDPSLGAIWIPGIALGGIGLWLIILMIRIGKEPKPEQANGSSDDQPPSND